MAQIGHGSRMTWDLFDPSATIVVEVEGVQLTLRPLSFSGKMTFVRKLASIDVTMLDMASECDVDASLQKQCAIIADVITQMDGKDVTREEMAATLGKLQSPRTFNRISDAIWKAYHLDELKEKN